MNCASMPLVKLLLRGSQHVASCLLIASVVGGTMAVGQVIDPQRGQPDDGGQLVWYDVNDLGVEGRVWTDLAAPFDRLPKKAQGVVRDAVWNLSRNSAGMCVRFVSDSPEIHVRWTVTSERLAMPHMPATGVSGVDLYMRDAEQKWRWVACGMPKVFPTNTAQLASGLAAEDHEFRLYLPLYNSVSSVAIGIAKDKQLKLPPKYPADRVGPLVFYGTSITHGACATRTGLAHPAMIGRHFDRPIVNLGFSGNGRMEPEVGELLAEVEAAVFIIDCCPNMNGAEVAARTEPLVRQLREVHPHTPILLVEDRRYGDSWWNAARHNRNEENHAALRAAYQRLQQAGVSNLHYLEGDKLLGSDGEDTVDGSHPNDLGFFRHAAAFQEALSPLLSPTP